MLTNAKVGDTLLAVNPLYGDEMLTVTQTTQKRVVCGKLRFTRKGRRIGESSFYRTWAHIVTDAERAELRDAESRRKYINTILANSTPPKLRALSTDYLLRIKTLLEEANDA